MEEAQLLTTSEPASAADFVGGLDLFRTWQTWLFPWTFVGVEALCLVAFKTTLLGVLTGSTYGNVANSQLMQLHISCATALWVFGSIQMLAWPLRRGWLKIFHKVFGYACLLIWAFVVGPTSFYLSLFIKAGSLLGAFASIVLLDVTFTTYYMFWRAWRVVRERRQAERSILLHGNLMALGLLGTMTQLPQRLLQFTLVTIRAVCVFVLRSAQLPWAAATLERLVSHPFLFGISLVIGNLVSLFFIDGPRSSFLKANATEDQRVVFWGKTQRDEDELYPYDLTNCRVRWQWRARFAVFCLARGIVASAGWA